MILDPAVALILVLALALDAVVGDPDWLWRRLPHPVVLFGRMIGWLERALNRAAWSEAARRCAGILALVALLGMASAAGLGLHQICRALPFGLVLEVVLVAVLLAQNSLYVHVNRVARAFTTGGLEQARAAVSMVVGRDPATLDEAGVARAAIETTAENFSDGVVAPAFWYLVAGLPGMVAYKALNTADSMIGHKSPRYFAFGWGAARLDDLANLLPARLSGCFVIVASGLVGGRPAPALRAMITDARKHKSPNAGWPEAAMAGGLGLALAGPRTYAGVAVEDPWLNEAGRRAAAPADIDRALRVFVAACVVHATLVAGIAAVVLVWVSGQT